MSTLTRALSDDGQLISGDFSAGPPTDPIDAAPAYSPALATSASSDNGQSITGALTARTRSTASSSPILASSALPNNRQPIAPTTGALTPRISSTVTAPFLPVLASSTLPDNRPPVTGALAARIISAASSFASSAYGQSSTGALMAGVLPMAAAFPTPSDSRDQFHGQVTASTLGGNHNHFHFHNSSAGGTSDSEPLTPPQSVESEAGTYTRIFLPLTLGYPLWRPNPIENPPEHRRQGVNIGDVGRISYDGRFIFLFNIFLPTDSPANRIRNLDFTPLGRPACEPEPDTTAFPPGKVLKSPGITLSQLGGRLDNSSNVQPLSFQFVCPPPEGAILVLPNGATRNDLVMRPPMEAYIKQNIARWYSSIGERENLVIVTGVDKCSSWGTACYSNARRTEEISFTPVSHPSGDSPACDYEWRPPNSVSSYSGRSAEADCNQNQCIFFRGYKSKLRRRTTLLGQVSISDSEVVDLETNIPIGRDNGRQDTPFMSWISSLFHSTNANALQNQYDAAHDTIQVNEFPIPNEPFHPSDLINSYLLDTNPDAQIAITHDDIWCNVIQEDDAMMGGPDLLEQVIERYSVVQEHGCVSFTERHHNEPRGAVNDLEDIIKYHRKVLDLHPPGHSDHSASLNILANTLSIRFMQLGQMEDLEEAITLHKQALDLYPLDRSASLNNLANSLSTRFEQLGKIGDLEEAIMLHQQVLDLRPPGHPGHSTSLNNLANTLFIRFEQLGKMGDLQEAITLHRQALNLRPPGHPDRSASLNNLANALFTHFEQLGMREDLEEAITLHRQALDLCPPGHPDRSTSLNNLANTLFICFEQLGKMADLQEAITLHRKALNLRPPSHPDHSASLNNLANALFTHFERLGMRENLEEAIALHRQALDLCPPGHPDRSTSLNNLANTLFTRFEQLDKMGDLEEAIMLYQQALRLCPPGHPDRSLSLNNLARAVSARFECLGLLEDIEQAINYSRQALNLCPPSHPNHSASLTNLANAISTRFEQLHQMEDLEEVIKLYSGAEKALHPSHPGHARATSLLASSMLQLSHHSKPSEHTLQMTSDPFDLFERATHHSTSPAHDRFLAALRWVEEARRCRHSSLLHAYSATFTCLNRCVTLTRTAHSWQKFLARVPRSLASDAASSAIETGDLESAVELLEHGRAILWSKMQGFRHPHQEKLREIDADLADEFDRVSRELERHATTLEVDLQPRAPGFFDSQTREYRILSEKWDELVVRIRQIPGFANFLQAVPFATLQFAAAEGPVIMVNISQYRSDAIILQRTDRPVLVHLPHASPDMLHNLSRQLSSSLARNDKAIFAVLRNLWDVVVRPIVEELAVLGLAEKSRIWWCPTSQLCGLPLHAAGPYKRGQKLLPDIYVSSYTPTLFSLIKARSNVGYRTTGPKVLAIGYDVEANLSHIREELRRIESLGNHVDVLIGENVTRETLLPRLKHYPWVHFACHGYQVANEPFHSYFQLHDHERLTIADLIKTRLSDAEFAFLSACHTAASNDDSAPDEVIHFAAALQFCGFRSVVGTLWAMVDSDGPDVAEEFYKFMFREGGRGDFRDSAMALNRATRQMRRRGVPVDRWATFVHIGA